MSLHLHSNDVASRRIGLGLAVPGLLVILVATLYPIPNQAIFSAATPLLCLLCGQLGGQDVVLNLLLFVPFAIGLRLLGWPWIRIVGVSALLSFTVEALQFFVIPGRDASLSDLLANTAGGALGATLAPALRQAANPSPGSAARRLLGGAAVLLAIQGLSAWLLSPASPPGKLSSRWANAAPGGFPFFGKVRSVRLNGAPMPAFGAVPDSAAARDRLDDGSFALDLELTSGAGATDRRWIYMVKAGSVPLLAVDQYDRDLYFAVPAQALLFRLQPPTLRLRQGFSADSGQVLRVTAGEDGRRLWLTSSNDEVHRSFELSLSPSHGWCMIIPFGFALGPETRWFTALWLASMFAPLGFWAARTGRRLMAWATVAATLTLALAVIPAVSGSPPVHWSEWLAGALGTAAGWAAHRLARYLQTRCASPSSNAYSSS